VTVSRLRALPILGLVMALLSSPATADLRYEHQTTSDGVTLVIVSGVFEQGDDLQAFALAVDRLRPKAVMFDSPGGQPQKAMELGRLIRTLGLSTYQPSGPECLSACALAFLGGVERYADPGAIGVHKTYFEEGAPLDPAEAVSAIQELTADTLEYLSEMRVGPGLLELSMRYESTDVRYLSGSEMAELGVTTSEGPQDDAAALADGGPGPNPKQRPQSPDSRSSSTGSPDAPPEAVAAAAGRPMPVTGTSRANPHARKACCD
jgi:hypothetical protein